MIFTGLFYGIFWSCFLGLIIGNFATNPIYRLPRGAGLFIEDPYCDSCHAKLEPRDLFPLFSWIFAKGRCRYCGVVVPGAYALTEALTAIVFVICYLQFGFSEKFLLISLGMTSLIMLAMMLVLDGFFSNKTLIASLVLGSLFRTLQDNTIYNFLGNGYAGLIVGLVIWKLSDRPLVRDVKAFPEYLKLLVVAGVWLSFPQLALVLLMMIIFMPLKNYIIWLPEWIIIVSTITLVLTNTL